MSFIAINHYYKKLKKVAIANSLLTIYLIVVLGSWYIMFTYGYPFITQSTHVSNHHKTMGYVVFGCCVYSWYKAHSSNPGYITHLNIVQYDNYPYDNLLFMEHNTCPTMNIQKLARSKYDRFSKRHVARFDHYCGWVKNAIGEENYRFFLFFLLIHVSMCIYGFIVTYYLFHGEIEEFNLYHATYFDGLTGQEYPVTTFIVLHYLFLKYLPLAMVFILMACMCIILGLFAFFHLWIAAKGMTTNEYYKWKQVHVWYQREIVKYERAKREGKVIDSNNVIKKRNIIIGDGDVGCVGPTTGSAGIGATRTDINDQVENTRSDTDHDTTITTTTTTSTSSSPNHDTKFVTDPGPYPTNIYNLGIIENYQEIIFPRCLRKDALQRLREERKRFPTGQEEILVKGNEKTKAI